MYHYFYKITNDINGNYYYGVHSTNNLDDGYLGSGIRLGYAKNKYGIEHFHKEILKFFDTADDAYNYESEIVNESLVKDPNCYNCMVGGVGVHGNGVTCVKDKDGNHFFIPLDDSRYLSGEFKNVFKGYVNVKDKYGHNFKVKLDDPRFLSGELVGQVKGSMLMKNKDGDTKMIELTDPLYISGEYVPFWTGKSHTDETKEKMHLTHLKNNHQKGEKNSQYGTCWITRGTENKKIKKDEIEKYILEGYSLGRYIKPKEENYRNIMIDMTCPVCGKKFTIKKIYVHGDEQKCCSKSCAAKYGWMKHNKIGE